MQWLSEQGTEIQLQPGEQIAKQGDPPDGFYIFLEGKTEWTQAVSGQEVHAVTLEGGCVCRTDSAVGGALSHQWTRLNCGSFVQDLSRYVLGDDL
ncbi:MAG: hypothetical protein BRC46_04410 [Cyanobacteria bacterium QS_6_48_18]|nr:MAG: hypothetical protein BRC46_04410 [Cyanobacteria bacterium QS_6_48_18]